MAFFYVIILVVMKMKNSIVIYYTKSGNSKLAVNIISEALNCQVEEITMQKEYPEDPKEFVKIVREHLKEKTGPLINPVKTDIQLFDNLYVVSPNWGDTMAPPLRTLFNQFEFTNMNIFPVMTHGGNGVGHYVEDLIEITKNCHFSKPFVYKSDDLDVEQLKKWIFNTKK